MKFGLATGFALLAIAGGAIAQTAPIPAGAARPVAGEGYKLGSNDEIEVTIFGPQNSVTRTRVKEDGTVTLPFIGAVTAVGRTAREFATEIGGKLKSGGFFTKPVVSVDVTQYVSNSVTVSGEVGSPGVLPLDRESTVGMMVARAGGTRQGAADYVMLRRASDPAEHRIVLAQLTGDWSAETSLVAGDTLYVPVAPQVFVYGQVNGPGAFPMLTGMTVRQALVRAGGPTLAGSEKNISVYRGSERLKKVKLDSEIKAGDIVYIHERLF